MLGSGVAPSMPTWSALLNAYADSKQVGGAGLWRSACLEAGREGGGAGGEEAVKRGAATALRCPSLCMPRLAGCALPARPPAVQPLRAVEALKLMRAQGVKPSVQVRAAAVGPPARCGCAGAGACRPLGPRFSCTALPLGGSTIPWAFPAGRWGFPAGCASQANCVPCCQPPARQPPFRLPGVRRASQGVCSQRRLAARDRSHQPHAVRRHRAQRAGER